MSAWFLPLRPISVDFEYIPQDGGTLEVVCVVTRDLWSREVTRRWRDELGALPPYPIGPETVLVAHNAQAEIEAHLSLGWPVPMNIIDTFAENMLVTNGLSSAEMRGVPVNARGSLLAALKAHGLPHRAHEAKRALITRILAGPPYSVEERSAILNYCQEDVDDTACLLDALLPKMRESGPGWLEQALVRGRYAVALAHMTRNGCPIDADLHDRVVARWGPTFGAECRFTVAFQTLRWHAAKVGS
jgi:hypothetical protein